MNFPVLDRLEVDQYKLYPAGGNYRLQLRFDRGPTLIAGVNGLGKSTLIAIMLRLLTGPEDLPKPAQDGDLGEVAPEPVPLDVRRLFTSRVSDEATSASATLQFSVGGTIIRVTRALSNLSLTELKIDGEPIASKSLEDAYKARITQLIGVGSFFDVLLIFRYVIFLLEDRRALVWGATSQRELLRAIFIPPQLATRVSKLRYDMLSKDSGYRNTRAILNRRIRENDAEIAKMSNVSGAKTQLNILGKELDEVHKRELNLQSSIGELEKRREEARLAAANAALERDSATRELDRAKVQALKSHFDGLDDNSTYVLAKLAAESWCVACDTKADDLGKQVTDRLAQGLCPVCGTPQHKSKQPNVALLSARQIEQLQKRIVIAEETIAAQNKVSSDATEKRRTVLVDLDSVTKKKFGLSDQIRRLRSKLPTGDRTADDLADRNAQWRQLMQDEFDAYTSARAKFEKALQKSQEVITGRQQEVANAFQKYAREFLQEECSLTFQPVRVKIGQTGELFEVSLFQLSMSGAAVGGQTVRSEPDQVSLSQREFLDLAFRMALMTVASDGPGTLVVDAPESSLDFRFAERAGNQLASFSKAARGIGNRVIVTSNLSNAELIPAFLKGRPPKVSASARVIDLLQLAATNPRIERDRKAYADFLQRQIVKAEHE